MTAVSSPRASSRKAGRGTGTRAESPNQSGSKDQDHKLKTHFQVDKERTSSPQSWQFRVLLVQM